MKILRVNMGTGSIRMEELGEKYRLLGNRGLVSSLIYNEVVPTCSPIGPNNKLYIASSPLEGFGVTSTGRISVGAKSPLTGGIKEANAGGTAGSRMARQGIRAIAFEGAAEGSWIHRISSAGSELLEASEYAGLGTYETTKRLLDRFGRDSSVISIGPSGEKLLLNAGVFVSDVEGDSSRAAARGGLGAVMGSKGLKAIVIQNDGNNKPEPSDKEGFI
ncbi:MAG: aldehyde ferredoxin oxidoreductase, partial [Youngiibacter sp.]|nr:aldehyde ferredoxin oxidoreductase [Youngiibacter sp.]